MAREGPNRAPASRISPSETAALLSRGQAVAVDVRSPTDYANGHIPGAISAPINRLARLLPTLPNDKTLVFY